MLEVEEQVVQGFYATIGKRWLDVTLATAGLLALSGPMLMIAIAVACSSKWPILFVQERVGLHGRRFRLIKFRTMVKGAELGSSVTLQNDPRTTSVGRFLRKYKLDELPQLWNVVRGEMSFVGPRPDVPGFADQLVGPARRILELRPGITGPASLRFADEEAVLETVPDAEAYNRDVIFPEKVRINLEYAKDVTFWGDLSCLIQTLGLWVRRP